MFRKDISFKDFNFDFYLHFLLFRFISPHSKDEKEEEGEKTMPITYQFYSIDDVEPVETPDGGFAPDYSGLPPQYINETSNSKIPPRESTHHNRPKELNLIKGDVSALSKKLLEIQEEVISNLYCFILKNFEILYNIVFY